MIRRKVLFGFFEQLSQFLISLKVSFSSSDRNLQLLFRTRPNLLLSNPRMSTDQQPPKQNRNREKNRSRKPESANRRRPSPPKSKSVSPTVGPCDADVPSFRLNGVSSVGSPLKRPNGFRRWWRGTVEARGLCFFISFDVFDYFCFFLESNFIWKALYCLFSSFELFYYIYCKCLF